MIEESIKSKPRKGKLHIVGTPIGNLDDLTFRALRILEEVDFIACEDTRQTKKILNKYNFTKRLISYYQPKEQLKIPLIIKLLKEGKDLLLAYGSMVSPALKAAKKLEKEGISLAVVNARFAKPLDKEMILRFARKGRAIITAEEGVAAGGFGSAVRELLDREKKFDVRFKSIGIPLEIYPLGKTELLKKKYLLDEKGLFLQIKEFYGVAS